MSAFFLMAGFFARVLVERRGPKAFVKDRGKRVAVPLFLLGPVVMVMIGKRSRVVFVGFLRGRV
jgi:glucan biosynthesis protein C